VSPRHRYYRRTVWHQIPGWWYAVAAVIAGGAFLAVLLSGGIGLDGKSGHHRPGPSQSSTGTPLDVYAPTSSPAPTVTVTETATERAKPRPTKTITVSVTPTQSGKPVIKEVPGPTVTKTGAPSTVHVPGPKVTKTGAASTVATEWPQADGVNCITETQVGGVSHFSAPHPC
jgi:hypothetical protein